MKKLLTALLAVLLLTAALSVGPVSANDPSAIPPFTLSIDRTQIGVGEDLDVFLSYALNRDYLSLDPPAESVTANVVMGRAEYDEDLCAPVVLEQFTLREFEDFSKYVWDFDFPDGGSRVFDDGVTVPAAWLSSPRGRIFWQFTFFVLFPGETEESGATFEVALYYRRDDGVITLYQDFPSFQQSFQTGCNQTLFARV